MPKAYFNWLSDNLQKQSKIKSQIENSNYKLFTYKLSAFMQIPCFYTRIYRVITVS